MRIWQQNVNKSLLAQEDLLHRAHPNDYDLIAIQEPYLDRLALTRSTTHWRVVYPSPHRTDAASRSRSVLLINKKLSTNNWNPISIPHADVTAVTIRTEGAASIHLFNLYVDAHSDTAIHATVRAMRNLGDWDDDEDLQQQALWIGDFNRHHQRWDDPGNAHLFTSANVNRAEILTRYLDVLGLEMRN
ncbi:hypothetical protein NUW54_g6474 [Trametes sanguinea]|uniref:Uncharacterized protein n=1 Tax=Trametes sanguinea TaxID=158606 RepID=A0ACC1PTB2_9APHY|nr:hypothetical protein NUW54_g6474 [Trametes sanguinea]